MPPVSPKDIYHSTQAKSCAHRHAPRLHHGPEKSSPNTASNDKHNTNDATTGHHNRPAQGRPPLPLPYELNGRSNRQPTAPYPEKSQNEPTTYPHSPRYRPALNRKSTAHTDSMQGGYKWHQALANQKADPAPPPPPPTMTPPKPPPHTWWHQEPAPLPHGTPHLPPPARWTA